MWSNPRPGGHLNIKMSFLPAVLWPSYLYNENTHTQKDHLYIEMGPFFYNHIRHLILRSHKISHPWDWVMKCSCNLYKFGRYNSSIFQMSLKASKHQFCRFKTLQDFYNKIFYAILPLCCFCIISHYQNQICLIVNTSGALKHNSVKCISK